jgi:hypothetical protein
MKHVPVPGPPVIREPVDTVHLLVHLAIADAVAVEATVMIRNGLEVVSGLRQGLGGDSGICTTSVIVIASRIHILVGKD